MNLIKLVSGEEIFAKTEDLGDKILIKNAVQFVPTPQGIEPIKWPLFAKKEIDISLNKNSIVYTLGEESLDERIVDVYKEIFREIVVPQIIV